MAYEDLAYFRDAYVSYTKTCLRALSHLALFAEKQLLSIGY